MSPLNPTEVDFSRIKRTIDPAIFVLPGCADVDGK